MTTATLDARTVEWVRRRLPTARRRSSLPEFGSPDWHRLDDSDPRKMAAVVLAAACWWDSKRPARIAQELHDELAVTTQLAARDFAQVAARVRAHAHSPSWEQIRQRWAS